MKSWEDLSTFCSLVVWFVHIWGFLEGIVRVQLGIRLRTLIRRFWKRYFRMLQDAGGKWRSVGIRCAVAIRVFTCTLLWQHTFATVLKWCHQKPYFCSMIFRNPTFGRENGVNTRNIFKSTYMHRITWAYCLSKTLIFWDTPTNLHAWSRLRPKCRPKQDTWCRVHDTMVWRVVPLVDWPLNPETPCGLAIKPGNPLWIGHKKKVGIS